MAKVSKLYGGEYLKASDLDGDTKVTIAGEETRRLGKGKDADYKLVLALKDENGKPTKKLILNKTNSTRIAKMHGDDSSAWVGKSITLYSQVTEFEGDPVDAIRVRITE